MGTITAADGHAIVQIDEVANGSGHLGLASFSRSLFELDVVVDHHLLPVRQVGLDAQREVLDRT